MLDALRNSAKSWVVKLFLLLLVLSFGVWGISGTVFQGAGNSVVTVGDTRVTPIEFRLAYDRQVANLSRQFGTRLTREQARAMGIENQVLIQVAMNAALDEQSRRMNLGLSEGRLATLIAEDPIFQGIDGRFDRSTFSNLLRNVGISEEEFVVSQENTAIRSQIVEAISDGYKAPKTLLQAVNQFDNETRTLDYVVLNPDIVGTIAEPTDEEIKTYFEDNKTAYRAPEYRKIAYVTLRASDLADPAAVADESVRSDYETYADRYRTPETRTVEQLSFANDDAAKAAADKLAAGESFEDVVAAESKTMNDVLLGTFERQAIPDQAIADAAFAISPAGATSGVVEGTFGPVILRVTAITPENTKSFEEVEDSIRNDLALVEAENILLDVHDAYEDARAGGETLEEAAKKQKLTPVIIDAVDRTAQTPDGEILRDLPESRRLLAEVFDTDINVESAPINLGADGFMWYEVQDITPARDRTLDEVRTRAIDDWKREQAATALGKLATELQKRVKDGEELSAVAADQGLVTETKYNMKRRDEDAVLGTAAVNAAFAGPEGLVAVADDAGGTSKILMQVSSVSTPDASEVASLQPGTDQALSRRMGDDMLTQAISLMQTDFGVSYDPAAAELAISSGR
ncbi:SurA N-terminal domain-containing protein [Hoeflea sp. TYP-13]|uniref:peptidylprolyl isomerase n=1 Tax=Hoeflea sp. TYP-13 TaxID=3230023 RepID=UPI0034C5E13B